jgi:hypothetical protein
MSLVINPSMPDDRADYQRKRQRTLDHVVIGKGRFVSFVGDGCR